MKKPYIIGIAGGLASGKTTFCNLLLKNLEEYSIKSFHMDKYLKKEKEKPFSKSPVTSAYYVDDSHPLAINMMALKKNLKVAMQMDYDIILIEGVLVLWDDEIYSTLDLKLFVDCLPDERIVRKIKRNIQWGLTFDEISNNYLDLIRFRHNEYVEPTKWKADLILNGSNFSDTALKMITENIKNKIDDN